MNLAPEISSGTVSESQRNLFGNRSPLLEDY